jgi:SET domain
VLIVVLTGASSVFLTFDIDTDGEKYFVDRPTLGPIPLNGDLEKATRLLQKSTQLQRKLERTLRANATSITLDVWTTFVANTKFIKSRVLLGGFRHHDANDLLNIQTLYNGNLTAARLAESHRKLDWLQEFGTCGDHIVGRPSTLPQAGMGAFATRTLPIGTIVADTPMIHITKRSRLEMFDLQQGPGGKWEPIDGNVTRHQLLLNYCYGHGESTMLLCPYGPMVNYVNHNQTQANVRLQWGKSSRGNHFPDLLNKSLDSIARSGYAAKLAMELVATREIQEGEEIFLDYGHEWETAWRLQTSSWSPSADAFAYVSAVQLHADRSSRLRTVFEEILDKRLPDNVEMLCDTTCQTDLDEIHRHYRADTLDGYLREKRSAWWPCNVLRYRLDEHKNGHYLYTVHLFQNDTGTPSNGVLVEDVPRAIFQFVDNPYTSDTYLPTAFRHDIRIPDEIFPLSWRNSQR